jgi:hypothetical protein
MSIKSFKSTGNSLFLKFKGLYPSGLILSFPPPLRSGGNAAVEQRTPDFPLRCGENKEFETDAPPGHCSTAAL